MSEKVMENNRVTVIGTIVSDFTFSHAVFGEGFYLVDLSVNRLSEQADVIPLMVSERIMDVTRDYRGCTIEADGQFRSYNRHEGVKNRLVLSVFVREVQFLEEFTDYTHIQENAPGTRDRGPSGGREPSLWEVRLHSLHCLGKERPVCLGIFRGDQDPDLGPGPEPGIHEKAQ